MSASRKGRTELLHLSGLPVGQELIPECEVISECDNDTLCDRFENCEKNESHKTFIPVKDFSREHLPEHLRTDKIMRSIENRINRTVRVVVRYTSKDRPDKFSDNKTPYPYVKFKGSKKKKRYGTGIIMPFGNLEDCKVSKKKKRNGTGIIVMPFGNLEDCKAFDMCPCPECKTATHKKEFWLIKVQTATHVIYDDDEVKHSEFDCFFDTDDGAGVKKLYGYSMGKKGFIPGSNYKSDLCNVSCVTHDKKTMERLSKEFECTFEAVFDYYKYSWPPPEDVIVSHPHGCKKLITVGSTLYYTCPIEDGDTMKLCRFPADTICRLPMKPWVSDKQLSERIQIKKKTLRTKDHARAQPRTGLEKTIYIKHVLRYMETKPIKTPHDEENINNLLLAIACGVYWYMVHIDLIYSACLEVETLNGIVKVLLYQRLCRIEDSGTKIPELLDVGLLLWRCYLIILMDMFKNLRNMFKNLRNRETLHRVTGDVVNFFLQNICEWKPKLLPLFDIGQYVAEKLKDEMFSDYSDAMKAVVKIMFHDEFVTDSDRYTYNDTLDDKSTQLLIGFCTSVNYSFKFIQNYHQFYDKAKTLVDSDSNDFLKPGTEFLLPSKLAYLLPSNAEYRRRYYKGDQGYFKFPPETRFGWVTDSNFWHIYDLPDEAEFLCLAFSVDDKILKTYNTDTCPGSSGACLHWDLPIIGPNLKQVHHGQVGKYNRSGIAHVHDNFIEYTDFLNHCKERGGNFPQSNYSFGPF